MMVGYTTIPQKAYAAAEFVKTHFQISPKVQVV